MREIKFRSFYEVQGKYEPNYSDPLFPHLFWENLYRKIYDIDPQQYIGLKDSNEKEIYEGDIVKFYDEEWYAFFDEPPIFIGIIKYIPGCFCIESGEHTFILDLKKFEVEIIGNIHQNPELLDNN